MSEHITRGQFMRFFQIAIRRGPAGLRKAWLYENLKPMVDALEKDLNAAQETAKNEPQEPEKTETQAEAAPVKEGTPEPAQEPAKKAEKKDLGNTPKKPARKGKK